jgi:hypothetical protein
MNATVDAPRDPLASLARIAFFVAAIAALAVCLRPDSILCDKPFTEDGYYLLSAGRHIALGNGVSVDGVHPTNGIQPLYAFLAAPAYWLAGGDRVQALRGVLLLNSVCFVAAAWLFGRALRDFVRQSFPRREALRWIASCFWLASGYLFVLAFNGLETGLLLLLYVAYWHLSQKWPLRGPARAAVHGALLGVLVLTRIDATFFVAALTALHVLHGDRPLSSRLGEATVAGLTAIAVSSPWWIYNVVEFGSLMPTSGTAQSAANPGEGGFDASRVIAAARNLLLVATPALYTGDGAGSASLLLARGAVLLFVVIAVWRLGRSGGIAAPGSRSVVWALALAGLAFAVYYPLKFWATHFYYRYFVPMALFGLGAFVLAVMHCVSRPRRIDPLLPLALVLCGTGIAGITLTGRGFSGNEWLRDQVALVREHVPPGARLAAGQSGTLGYFVDGVHNLDGKVNFAALQHQDDMGAYLAQHDIEWLCDWPAYLHRYVDSERLASEWTLIGSRGEFQLWRRRS